jgi:hypothetical protein
MIIEDERSRASLEFWCRRVSRMKPDERLEVDPRDLRDIASYEHNEMTFTPPDRILGNIMGSTYTHSYWQKPDGRIVFARHKNTGERRHKDPDDDYRLARLRGR